MSHLYYVKKCVMKKHSSLLKLLAISFFSVLILAAFLPNTHSNRLIKIKFPYKQAGLTDKQAAAHLVSRFTFGATPNMIDEVVKQGLENWFQNQLDASFNDDSLNNMLQEYDALKMSNADVEKTFPRNAEIRKMAIDAGYITKDEVAKGDDELKDKLAQFRKDKNFRPEKELFRQFINQKILRATYSNNQLQEVMTDFWFNHFNVSITKPQCASFIPVYERDAIRPNSLGKFEDLIFSTAKSPAMLLYLDNASSAGENEQFENKVNNLSKRILNAQKDTSEKGRKALEKLMKRNKTGLNENYAREVMELHTLGVDGGYTQKDVTEAARVLTGWTVYPITDYGPAGAMKKMIEKFPEEKLKENGFVHEGDFLFAVSRHDDKEKTVLGKKFAAGGGYDEGVSLLKMLAHHNSTAKFICKKLATRFVSDNPPQSLIDKMAKTFLAKDGDIKQVLITLVSSPEFWSKNALREKTKSPFELTISTVRILDADVLFPFQLNDWITKMGQKVYFYQAPTGFPDRAQYWINTGSLLNRMNFGLAIAAKKIPGVRFNLAELNHNKEPESAEKALEVYCKILLPQRDVEATIKRLTPMLSDPNLMDKVNKASKPSATETMTDETMMNKENASKKKQTTNIEMMSNFSNSNMLAQVVGVIIGSPEFQRR